MPALPISRIKFFLAVTFAIWLVVCVPLAILFAWLSSLKVGSSIAASVLLALPLAAGMWFAVQSPNLYLKWPVLQLLGLTTILITVLLVTSPLLLFMATPSVGQIALLIWLLTALYAAYSAIHIKDINHTIVSDKLNEKIRIVHLSDLHAGSRGKRHLQKVVAQSLKHQPDAIVITGDLLDSSAVDKAFLAPLAAIDCPVWMSLGNHERYVDLASAIAAIENQQITVLRNEVAQFKSLCIIGVDDTDNPADAAAELEKITLPTDQFTILLYHRPDGWQAAIKHRIDLMLAGHTHAGQIWPFGLLVKRQFPQMAGYFTQADSHMVVSQGAGTWGPTFRLGTRNEIIVLDLEPTTTR